MSSNPSSATNVTATAVGPAGNQIAAQSGTAVMFAEVVYDYQPLMAGNLLGNHHHPPERRLQRPPAHRPVDQERLAHHAGELRLSARD